ncbi:(4Fe-4S)-binding protein [Longispora sp. K20-0274]|uniref:ferredoxin n=1 Tax=Longispora sp. K20-0274 TaxID=3088255 RepID=UPI00399A356D
MRVTVSPDACCGSGQCALRLPEVFDQSDVDGTVVLLAERPAEALRAALREAVLTCPSGAIEVSED